MGETRKKPKGSIAVKDFLRMGLGRQLYPEEEKQRVRKAPKPKQRPEPVTAIGINTYSLEKPVKGEPEFVKKVRAEVTAVAPKKESKIRRLIRKFKILWGAK